MERSGDTAWDRPLPARLWREAWPTALLLLGLTAAAVVLQVLGRAYLLVFAMNVSMVTLVLTLVIYRRYRDWRVLPLTLLFLCFTVEQTVIPATEILGASTPAWVVWVGAMPLVVPTLLGFAAVVYLWRVFEAQASLQQREQRLAARVQQAQRLESLGIMAGGVAHDFSNLLTTILGNAALIQLDAPAGSELAASAASIQKAAERAGAISRQMLDYSGCGKFRLERVGLGQLCARLRPLLESYLPARIHLVVESDTDALPTLYGDPSQLQQVLVNLVTNAVEAVAGNGTITLRISALRVDEATLASGANSDTLAPGDYVSLEVLDTGEGMNPATRRRMFDPFFSTRGVGRGMGLAAVLGIVRGHRGTVLVESQVGHGTLVQVLLPAASPGDPQTPNPRGAETS